jgi:hypothetical protein
VEGEKKTAIKLSLIGIISVIVWFDFVFGRGPIQGQWEKKPAKIL